MSGLVQLNEEQLKELKEVAAQARVTMDSVSVVYKEQSSISVSCNICREKIREERVTELKCGHFFHTDCYIAYVEKKADSCPDCAKPIEILATHENFLKRNIT